MSGWWRPPRYCDHLAVLGYNAGNASNGLRCMMPGFEWVGFLLHEVEAASLRAKVLGGILGG